MKFSKLSANLLFAFFVLILTFAGLEIIFRTTHIFGARVSWSAPDPFLGWRFVPGRTYQNFKENDHPVKWKTNRYGWIDTEWTVSKTAGTYRVAALGDSFVEGMQVEEEYHFLNLAEKKLNRNSSHRFEFMNFGRSGFTQAEELLVLQNDIVKFSPDAVMLFFFPSNDIADIRKETAPDIIRPFYTVSKDDRLILDTSFKDSKAYKLKSLLAPLKHQSAFISFLSERLTLYRDMTRAKNITSSKETAGSGLLPYLTLATSKPDPEFIQNYALNKRIIREIASFCAVKGIRLILANIPNPAYLPEIESKYQLKDASFNVNYFEDDLKKFADSIGADFIGLQSAFRETYLRENKDLNWKLPEGAETQFNPMEIGHWNYAGHQTAAEILRNYFTREKLGSTSLPSR